MNKTVLKGEKINKSFFQPDEFHVLNDVNISIGQGEFVTIMGKSGCGKSTLLYILSTLDTEYQGNVEINGECVSGWSEKKLAVFRNRNIGFVFQFHFLLPEFTALENVIMPALKLGMYDRQKIEADGLKRLEQLDVLSSANKLASKLSGGQQQRLAIARALINNPAIILADEPTGNLDSVNSAIVLDIFAGLAKQGNTIVAVTHDRDFAMKSDRIVEMSDGKLVTA